jgi:hypothetical protein
LVQAGLVFGRLGRPRLRARLKVGGVGWGYACLQNRHLISEGDNLQWQQDAPAKTTGPQGKDGGIDREHVGNGTAIDQLPLCFPDLSNLRKAQSAIRSGDGSNKPQGTMRASLPA